MRQTYLLAKTFPELRIVRGIYIDPSWGERDHFWCIDENDSVIDPTQDQFPSHGKGIYAGNVASNAVIEYLKSRFERSINEQIYSNYHS